MRERAEMCRSPGRGCLNVQNGALLATPNGPWSRSHELAVLGKKEGLFIYSSVLLFIFIICEPCVCQW